MKIFLSAVTSQFKDCRNAVASDLRAIGAEVAVQEDFQQHGGSLLEKLENYIASSDRVIALIGDAYGWEPEEAARPKNRPRRSYSQWEIFFALGERLADRPQPAKKLYVYFATPEFLAQNVVTQQADAAELQQTFVAELRRNGKDRNDFKSFEELRTLVLRDNASLHERFALDLESLRAKATEPAYTLIANAKTRWHYPETTIAVRMEETDVDQQPPVSIRAIEVEELTAHLHHTGSALLLGEAGVGKTTMLLSVCETLLDDPNSPLPIFIDAATWASSTTALLEHVASFPAFSATGLRTEDLSRLSEAGKLLIVLNGWNEIEVHGQSQARNRLQQYLSGSSLSRMVVATRSASGFGGLPDAIAVTVLGFTWEEQQAFIYAFLPGGRAVELIAQLRADIRLRSVTKNPFVLNGVVALYRSGKALPDNLFDLFSAVIADFEADPLRSSALTDAPLLGCHRRYLEALAQTMNKSGKTLLSQVDARSAVVAVSRELAETGIFGSQVPTPANVIDALCGHHLLHRAGTTEVRFAHQRFQEFFGACTVLSRLADATGSEEAQTLLQTEILNWSYWSDSINLVAEKLAVDAALKEQASLLVELMTPVDLSYASDLAGVMDLASKSGTTWNSLVASIEQLYGQQVPEGREYALRCAVATRSPTFAPRIWPLIEDSNQQVRLNGYRLAGGITLGQLGSDAGERIAAWTADHRKEAVFELAQQSENFDFIELLARSDPDSVVRANAIRALDDFFGATETALEVWRNAPDEVKEAEQSLSMVLDVWSAEDLELTAEILRLARNSKSDEVKYRVGLRLGSVAEELGVEAAKRILAEETVQRPAEAAHVMLLRQYKPAFLKEQAKQLFNGKRRLPDWALNEVMRWPADERDRLAPEALDRLSSDDNDNCDARVAAGASDTFVIRLVEEGAALATAMWRDGKQDNTLWPRLRAIERLLFHVQVSVLFRAIMNHIPSCGYDAVAQLVEILNRRAANGEVSSDESEGERWRPSPVDLDALISSVSRHRETSEIPSCKLEANLADLASKTDSTRYLDYVVAATKQHARALHAYHTASQRWVAEGGRSPRPRSPSFQNYFFRALRRCGFPAVPRVLGMAGEPGAQHIVPEILVAIVTTPWEEKRERKILWRSTNAEDHLVRISSGRVFLQPDAALQPVTDEVARFLVDQISAMTTKGGTLDGIDLAKLSPQTRTFWMTCTHLARVPSREGLALLQTILKRSDTGADAYVAIAQAVIAQGGKLPRESLAAIMNIWAAETSPAWLDENTQYQLNSLMSLHFFVEPIEHGLEQFRHLLSEWLKKVRIWSALDTLAPIPTREALEVLAELTTMYRTNQDLHERVIRAIVRSSLPESAEVLLKMAESGTLGTYAQSTFQMDRSVAPCISRAARTNPEFKQKVIKAMEIKTDVGDEALVSSVLGALDTPKAVQLVCRYLNEEAYPRGGRHATDVLIKRFSLEKPNEEGAGWYEVLPKADNALRRHLFELAVVSGASRSRARSLLLELEERRLERNRPANEPRHPAIETGSPWPTCLFAG
jgi:hypothetical protein